MTDALTIDEIEARITGATPIGRTAKRRKPTVELIEGDCRKALADLDANSVDAVVTDPPYGLEFMGKDWDSPWKGEGIVDAKDWNQGESNAYSRSRIRSGRSNSYGTDAKQTGRFFQEWCESWASECLRVLKPGGHLLAFGGSRTYHRLASAIEDAGFEIRDQIMWIYGSGFPKSSNQDGDWEGWGTALKPAHEPVVAGYKPVTATQHFAMIGEEMTLILAEEMSWSSANANDVEKSFIDTLAKCREVAGSVLDGARMRSLESIGIAPYAARSSTFSALASFDWTRTKGSFALSHVRPNGRLEEAKASRTRSGGEADTLTRLAGMCTSVMAEGMSESTVSSWPSILADLLNQANRYTTETVSKLTTVLKTFNCLLPQSTTDGTGGLSPSHEPIVVARKPLIGTMAKNLAAHGVGALNIDGCRVPGSPEPTRFDPGKHKGNVEGWRMKQTGAEVAALSEETGLGRWPANVIHDGSDEVLAAFPVTTSGAMKREVPAYAGENVTGFLRGRSGPSNQHGDTGSAARFFYCAKASKQDRDVGMTTPEQPVVTFATANGTSGKPSSISEGRNTAYKNTHPTVKPTALMRYLCRLVTPPQGTVLDPFMGSGSTGRGAVLEGFNFIGIEQDAGYVDIADARIAAAEAEFMK